MIPYFVDFKEESDQLELWVPRKSDYYKNAKWLGENYPSTTRTNVLLITWKEENNLTPEHIRRLFQIHTGINNISSTNQITWDQVCTKWPNPWKDGGECAENSLLEIWAENGSYAKTNQTLWTITDTEVFNDINSVKTSGIFNQKVNLNLYLGNITRENSMVKKANALQMVLMEELDQDNITSSRKNAEEFEQEYIYFMGNYSLSNQDLGVYYFASRSFDDTAAESIGGDLQLLSMGFIIVFIYVMLMLGNFNSVEQRAYLSLLGIVAILLGTGTCYGFCQLVGLVYGPMHSILPFLLLGIGIDDMFVIVQGLSNVNKEQAELGYEITTYSIIFYHIILVLYF